MENNNEKILTPRHVLGRTFSGIAYGCTWLTVFGIIIENALAVPLGTSDPDGVYTASFTEQALFSMLVGVGWVLPTLIYENERLGVAPKVLTHMLIGCGVFVPVAIHMHWFPAGDFTGGQIVGMISAYAGVCALVWLLFWLYYRDETKQINRKLREMNRAKTW